MSSEVDLEVWRRQRTWMFVNFCLGAFSFGLSLTAYFPTEYYYFKDTMGVKNPDLYYGLSWAFLCASGVIMSLAGSYYADSTKNVREVCLATNVVNVIGNVLYLLYFSPYVVLIGQCLVGTAAARMVAAVGEVSRVYEQNDLTRNISFLGVFSTIGSVVGPCLTYLFAMVDIRIKDWKLNINNMVGVTMGVLYFLQFILNFFTLSNVSKLYNIKEERMKHQLLDNMEIQDDEETNLNLFPTKELTFHEKYVAALSALFRNKQVLFLYAVCFFASYARATITLLQPIKSNELLSWDQINLATFNIICTTAGAIPTAIVLTLVSRRVNDFFLLFFTLLTLWIALTLMAILPIVASVTVIANITLYGNGILNLISVAGFHIMSRSMLAKFVPENIQTVTEAIRNALFEMAYMIAGMTVKFPSEYFSHVMFSLALIMSFILAWLLVDAKRYSNIEMISMDSTLEK